MPVTTHEPTHGVLLSYTELVAVYLDERLMLTMQDSSDATAPDTPVDGLEIDHAGHSYPEKSVPLKSDLSALHSWQETADSICQSVDAELLRCLGEWVGPVADIDGDGRLTFILTDLDRRKMITGPPILGCVREQDFQILQMSPMCSGTMPNRRVPSVYEPADVIYINERMPVGGTELRGLLAHEMTHAAIAGLFGNDHRTVPVWLNEAVAHWVELQFCDQPVGFSERVREFLRAPECHPVFVTDTQVPLRRRRGGCRAAATLFLESCLDEPRQLKWLIDHADQVDSAVSILTGESFETVFVDWCCELTRTQPVDRKSRLGKRRLNGTSFLVHHQVTGATIEISATNAAQIVVCVIDSDAGRNVTHLQNGDDTITHAESPDL